MDKLDYRKLFDDASLFNIDDIMTESIGTMQLDESEPSGFRKFIDIVSSDILSCKYANNISNRQAIRIKNYFVTKSFAPSVFGNLNDSNLYHISYEDSSISMLGEWILRLDVLIDETPYSPEKKKRMVTFGETIISEDTIVASDKQIISAPLIIISPKQNKTMLKYTIAHELNHLYMYWKQHIINKAKLHSSEYARLSALILKVSVKDDWSSVNFNNLPDDLNEITDNLELLKLYLVRAMYYLSNSEMSAHKENIFGEFENAIKLSEKPWTLLPSMDTMKSISPTFTIYSNIRKFLEYLKENLSLKTWEYLKWDGQDTTTDLDIEHWKSDYLINDRDAIMSYDEFADDEDDVDDYSLLLTIKDIARVFAPNKSDKITRSDFLSYLYNRCNKFSKNIWKMFAYCLKVYG